MLVPINIAITSNDGRSSSVNGSQLINLYAERLHQDSRVNYVLYGTPGQEVFVTLPTSPVLAMMQLDDLLYAVTSTALYSITSTGTVTSVGTVVQSGNVSIATNGIHIAFVDGAKGYYYSVAGGLHEFSGDGWYPADTVTFQDGYFIFNRKGTGQFFFTGILDTSLDPLDFATAEAAPDDTLGVFSDQSSLWLFGVKSIEIWYNDGVTPWSRMHGAYIERGIGSPYSVVKLDNALFFVGDDGIVYRTQGYSLIHVSTHEIESQFLSGDISDAYAYGYTCEGHMFYVLTIPSINRTCVYDAATKLWAERTSSAYGSHNGICAVDCFDKVLIGDFASGKILNLSMDVFTDDGEVIVRELIAPVLSDNQNRLTMWELETDVLFDLSSLDDGGNLLTEDDAFVLTYPDGDNIALYSATDDAAISTSPSISLRYSNDGCRTWSNERIRSFTPVSGQNIKVRWNGLGQFVRRHIKLTMESAGPVVIGGIFARVEGNDRQ